VVVGAVVRAVAGAAAGVVVGAAAGVVVGAHDQGAGFVRAACVAAAGRFGAGFVRLFMPRTPRVQEVCS